MNRSDFSLSRDWDNHGPARALYEEAATRAIGQNEGLDVERIATRAFAKVGADGSAEIHLVSGEDAALDRMREAISAREIRVVEHHVPKPTDLEAQRAIEAWSEGRVLPERAGDDPLSDSE